jgi:F0F1-type ATP synthase assembly protein I
MTSENTVPLLDYRKLEKRLTDLKSSVDKKVSERQALSENNSGPVSIIKYYWLWISASMLALIVFGAVIGAYLLDYSNRRRHGGFRI